MEKGYYICREWMIEMSEIVSRRLKMRSTSISPNYGSQLSDHNPSPYYKVRLLKHIYRCWLKIKNWTFLFHFSTFPHACSNWFYSNCLIVFSGFVSLVEIFSCWLIILEFYYITIQLGSICLIGFSIETNRLIAFICINYLMIEKKSYQIWYLSLKGFWCSQFSLYF